jgi:hypothetical protein
MPEQLTLVAPIDTCPCVARHEPQTRMLHLHHVWPLGWKQDGKPHGGPDTRLNKVLICPNTHAEVHRMLDGWTRHAQLLAGSRYARQLVRACLAYASGGAEIGSMHTPPTANATREALAQTTERAAWGRHGGHGTSTRDPGPASSPPAPTG